MFSVRDGNAAALEDDKPRAPSRKESDDYTSQLEVWYMAFDILYDGDHSVIDRPLRERHLLLADAVRAAPQEGILLTLPGAAQPVCGAIKLVVPGSPWSWPVQRAPGEKSTTDVVMRMLKSAMDNDEEGIVFKDLLSKWVKGDKSKAWMKFKPDYLPTHDLVRSAARACACCRQVRAARS